MANIGWDENSPADTSSVALGDDALRSIKTSVRIGLDAEHIWPSGGGDAGAHRLGSSRPYYGPQSAVSSSGTDGKTMVASDTSQFFHVGSAGTSLIGGPAVLSLGTYPGSLPQRAQWVEEIGAVSLNSRGSVTVTIPNSGYSGLPYVFQSCYTTANSGQVDFAMIYNLSASAFMLVSQLGSSASGEAFFWRSIGTRAL